MLQDIVHGSVLTDYADCFALSNVVPVQFVGHNWPLLSLMLNEFNCVHSPHDATRCPFTTAHLGMASIYIYLSCTALSRKQQISDPPLSINLRKHSFSFSSRLFFVLPLPLLLLFSLVFIQYE